MRRAFATPSTSIRNRLGLLTRLFNSRPHDPLEDTLVAGVLEDPVERKQIGERVQGALMALSKEYREVVVLRYGLADAEPKTLEEIGRRLGLTRERVRQIELESLRRLATLREMQYMSA